MKIHTDGLTKHERALAEKLQRGEVTATCSVCGRHDVTHLTGDPLTIYHRYRSKCYPATFKTITGDDWKRMFARAKIERNEVSQKICKKLK